MHYAGSDSALSDDRAGRHVRRLRIRRQGASTSRCYISPIAVIFNIDGVDRLNLDAATIAGIFKGTITTWDDPAIAALNPDAGCQSATITAVHRSDDSGTTKNFTDYLGPGRPAGVGCSRPPTPSRTGTGRPPKARRESSRRSTNGMNTIGYADASRAGKLGVAKLKVGDSSSRYSTKAAAAVVAGSPLVEGRAANDIASSWTGRPPIRPTTRSCSSAT